MRTKRSTESLFLSPSTLGYQVRQHPSYGQRGGEAGGLWRFGPAGQHHVEAEDGHRHSLLDGSGSAPRDQLQLEGGHLVSGHHGHRASGRLPSLQQHPPPPRSPLPPFPHRRSS